MKKEEMLKFCMLMECGIRDGYHHLIKWIVHFYDDNETTEVEPRPLLFPGIKGSKVTHSDESSSLDQMLLVSALLLSSRECFTAGMFPNLF